MQTLAIVVAMSASSSAAEPCSGQSCEAQKEVAIEAVWSHPVERTVHAPDKIVVTGEMKGTTFTPTTVTIPDPAGAEVDRGPVSFPLLENLAPLFEFRTFGVEERTLVERDGDALTVRCGAGDRPAGAAFSTEGFRYPRAMRGGLVIEGETASNFSFAVVPKGADAPDHPAASNGSAPALASIPASEWNDGGRDRELVVSCPVGAGTVAISSIHIVPPLSGGPAGVGTWVWDITRWLGRPEQLLLLLRSRDADDVFLQVSIDDGEVVDREELSRLIAILSAGGIGVHAVEGDPDMVTQIGRVNALERARVLRHFMETTGLRSVQYDIEPYLRPDHVADPAAGWSAWAETIHELAAALGGPVDVVVPFWILTDPAGERALQAVQDSVSGVTVMVYRTDVANVERIAEGWLSWGVARDLPIGIALENGPLPAEIHKTFVRAERGEVALDRSGERHSVLPFPEPVPDSGNRPVYSFSHEVEVSPSRISFLDDKEALARTRERLSRTLPAWESFQGLLIHDLITTKE